MPGARGAEHTRGRAEAGSAAVLAVAAVDTARLGVGWPTGRSLTGSYLP